MTEQPGDVPDAGAGTEAYVEAVLSLVEQVLPGRVTTYGDLAEALGRGGPRQVGNVLATWGAAVGWWRWRALVAPAALVISIVIEVGQGLLLTERTSVTVQQPSFVGALYLPQL